MTGKFKRCALVGLLVFFLGVSALKVEARSHELFSARTYYEGDEKAVITPADDKKESTTVTDPMATDPLNRYEHGYPNQEHVYNPVTEKYDDAVPKKTSETEATLPTEKTTTTETPAQPTGTIPNRYEAGYTNGHGTNMGVTYQQYTAETQPDEFTFDPVEGRYKAGYFPQSKYAGATVKTQNQTKTTQGSFQNRYEKGYFPDSEYTQQGYQQTTQGAKQVIYATNPLYSGNTGGNFNTMPYPVSGLPFVASGAGCRTAYWVQHVSSWPSFLKVTSTVGDAFGSQATGMYGGTELLQALLKYGSDPYNQLLRTGVTSLLNSYLRGAFPLSHMKVIEQFNAALVSKEAATAQALAFETVNVQSISAGSACT